MCIYFSELTNDQQVTVSAIFEDLPRSDIAWAKVLDLFDGLNGSIRISASLIRVSVKCARESTECQGGSVFGLFVGIDEQGCVGRHMIGYLQDFLRGVGVEPH